MPRSSSKPCAKKKLPPTFRNLHSMVNNLHEGLCREFVSRACFSICVKKAERILIESYHIVLYFEAISMPKNHGIAYAGTSFSIYSNSDNYHSESLSMSCQFLNCLLKSSHFLMFTIDYSLAPTHGSAIHPPHAPAPIPAATSPLFISCS